MNARSILLVVMLIAACGGSDQDASVDSTIPPETSPSSAAASSTTEAAAPSLSDLSDPMLSGFDVEAIHLLTLESGGGHRPLLEWEAVETADYYIVTIFSPDGSPYWAWPTEDSSVPVGGLPRLEDHTEGPVIWEGCTWGVIGYDATGLPVAASERRPISP